jgi:outer membrane receptor protein involved in Fe transport
MKTLRAATLSAIFVFWFTTRLPAQVNATGTFSGQVTDATGAPVANAQVKVTQEETGVSVTKLTATGGNYTVPLLKAGTYTLEVSAPGFKSVIKKSITLQIQQVAQQDFQLQVGDIQQQITVEGAPPLLNTESTEVGNVITEQSTQQLPLNGRNFSQLGLLVPGTNPGPVGGIRTQGNGNETQRGGAEIVADGSRGSFNTFMIDGLNNEDQSVGTLKIFPNLESIGEFKVQVGNYDAQFVSGGAVVNVITRSGGNQIHGSAFEFLRNADLNARQFFDAQKPPFQQNQFGGAIGGPIIKNKTFFFADYQGLRVHEASTSIVTEPTAAMRAGNFSGVATIYNPATYNATTNTRTQFPGNQIPATAFDPIATNLLAVIPLPNLAGNKNNLRLNDLAVQTQDQYDGRVDQVFTEKDSMFGRVTHGGADITYPTTPVLTNGVLNPLAFVQGAATAGSLRLNHAPSTQATLQEIHQFTPNILNQLALGYTRFALSVTPLDEPDNVAQRLGLQGANTGAESGAMASLGISGYAGYSSSNLPEIIPQNTWEASDTVSYVHGAHSLRFGFDVIHNGFGFFQLGAPSGSLSFSGVYSNNPATSSGGNGFADFLQGLPVSSSKSAAPYGVPYESYSEYGAFAQDQWRVNSRLTVNLGLRYDLFTPVKERYDRQSDFFLGAGSTLAIAGQNGVSDAILGIQKHNFSPRLGIAYRIQNKTVVRAAYGLFYFDEEGVGGSTRLFINNPFAAQYAVSCSATSPCLHTYIGIPNTPSANNLPTVVYQPTPNLTPNMQQWNFTLERQLLDTFVMRAAYVGSRGNHLNLNIQEDVATPGAGSVAAREPYPTVASISAWEPRGPSSYNGLQLSAEKRLAGGLSFLGAYTYSKSLDEGAGGNSSTGESRINIQNPRNLAADYGLSNFNYKHRFTLNAIYDFPFGRGRKFMSNANAFVNAVAGGWQLTSIVTAQSGAPFSVQLATPTANTGTFTRPNRICDGNLPSGQQSISEWYNVSCFVAPPVYTFGNTGRNVLIGPNLVSWDFGGDKDFRLTERFGLQFRSEFFNILNHPNFGLPSGSIGSTAAGTITTQISNARQIQFALRLHW